MIVMFLQCNNMLLPSFKSTSIHISLIEEITEFVILCLPTQVHYFTLQPVNSTNSILF